MGAARRPARREDRVAGRDVIARPAACSAVRAAAAVATLALAGAMGCASQGMPPGGPPDDAPPRLLGVTPESGTVRTSPSAVVFRFDEVVGERPAGAGSLEQLVVISPSDGVPSVSWGRNRIAVRPRRGWRPNTAYTVTVLAGLSDLRGNAAKTRFETVFSTGATIGNGVIRGATFDWALGRPAANARVDATVGGDTLLRFATASDSIGWFALGSLMPGEYLVRLWLDQNNNQKLDTREPWDTATVSLTDSVRTNLYAFARDTLGARLGEVSMPDSVTIRIRFDRPIDPAASIQLTQLRLFRERDSSDFPLAAVATAAAHDSLSRRAATAREDSAARADTSEAGRRALVRADSMLRARQRDSLSRAQTDSIRAARDTVKRVPPPVFARPVPATEFVIITGQPVALSDTLRLVVRGVQALAGPPRTGDRRVVRPRPQPRDSTQTKRPGGGVR